MTRQYKTFPQSHVLQNWSELLQLTTEEVEALQEQWNTLHEENKQMHKENKRLRDEEVASTADFLEAQGVTVRKFRTNGEQNGFLAWFQNNVVNAIEAKFPSYMKMMPRAHGMEQDVDGILLSNTQSPIGIVELHAQLTKQYARLKEQSLKQNKLFQASVAYVEEHDIMLEELSAENILRTVQQHAHEAYMTEHLPTGTDMHFDECDNCSDYTMGDRRCECGNRRVEVLVQGDILEGFHHTAVAW